MATLHAAADAGVTFFDTADVYGDGRSERLVGRLLRERDGEAITVATKMGRRARPDRRELLARALPGVERPLAREPRRGDARPRPAALPADRPLLPPGGLRGPRRDGRRGPDRRLRRQRRARRGGAEGDRVPGRRDRADHLQPVPPAARRACSSPRPRAAGSASSCACRSPRACSRASTRARRRSPPTTTATTTATARRSTSARRSRACRSRSAWTPSRSCAPLVPDDATLAQLALRWILMHDAVSTVIPGARSPEQARAQRGRGRRCPRSTTATMARIAAVYDERIAPHVHQRW